jgi:hypothetical protein
MPTEEKKPIIDGKNPTEVISEPIGDSGDTGEGSTQPSDEKKPTDEPSKPIIDGKNPTEVPSESIGDSGVTG